MIGYGAIKVIPAQFSPPRLHHLLAPLGHTSPMGMLWKFMGLSSAYTIFTGMVELVGGMILFIPSLTTLGALVSLAVFSNVFMLNLSYDVPVKLYSFHLLLMGIFLLVPDIKRLVDFLVLNRQVEPVKQPSLFRISWINRGVIGLQIAFGVFITVSSLQSTYQGVKEHGFLAPKPPLHGIWSVDEFVVGEEIKQPLLSDKDRWQNVVFDFSDAMIVQKMTGSFDWYSLQLDMEKGLLTLGKYKDDQWKAVFSIDQKQQGQGEMILKGELDGKEMRMLLHRIDENEFPLLNRGFRWINEYPHNR